MPEKSRLSGFLYFAVANAGRAGADTLVGTLNDGADALQVQVPTALSDIVRVADLVTELRPTTADITYFRHWTETPARSNRTRKL